MSTPNIKSCSSCCWSTDAVRSLWNSADDGYLGSGSSSGPIGTGNFRTRCVNTSRCILVRLRLVMLGGGSVRLDM